MNQRLILSTIGTSLLSNQIIRGAESESKWFIQLRNTANCTESELPDEVKEIIQVLSDRAQEKLAQNKTKDIRRASAELNGIYGYYGDSLPRSNTDTHCLVATDTAQGRATAEIVCEFLRQHGMTAYIHIPTGLSAANTDAFAEGIDELLKELEDIREKYDHVCFNLVGGFKIQQAYLNTIGMFHADEIIYIFEGSDSELIRIPRLPIQIDLGALQTHVVPLALMAQEFQCAKNQVDGIPEALLLSWNDVVGLSSWGKLIWSKSKQELLAQDLLDLPFLIYTDSFRQDFKAIKSQREKVKLQETLAKVSGLLQKEEGNLAILKAEGGVQYEVYTNNKEGIDHFRVTQSLRVSCLRIDEGLKLRHYGGHDYVQDNP